jgi:phosphate:Na+ symporter
VKQYRNFLKRSRSCKDLSAVYRSVTSGYTTTLQHLYKEGTAGNVNETEITTMLNFNREIFTGFKSLVFAAKDHLLDKEQSKHFDDLPGFIRLIVYVK